jgi:hypothetical protein
MADERPISASPLSAQEQARIRRERRQAKVREGGNNRLSRITATQGSPDFRKGGENAGYTLPSPEKIPNDFLKTETLPPPKLPTTNSTPDPPEIDISKFNARSSPRPGSTASSYPATHFTSTTSPEDELQQAMMMDQLYRLRGASSTPATPLEGDDGEDPLMKLLQQISGCAGLPPAMMGGKPPAIVEPQQARWSMLWSVLHAAGATSLALWTLKSHVEAVGRFDGTVEQRTESINLVKSQRPVCIFKLHIDLIG